MPVILWFIGAISFLIGVWGIFSKNDDWEWYEVIASVLFPLLSGIFCIIYAMMTIDLF